MRQWPARGPAELRSCGGLGEGYSSVAIANGVVYTCGMIRDQGYLFAIDSQGRKRGGEHWAHPAISDGRLCIRHGNVLMCYDIQAK